MSEPLTFRANGKLLLTGEYAILKGATGLALPLKMGQRMNIEHAPEEGVFWRALTPSEIWFEATFNNRLELKSTTSPPHADKLRQILLAASLQSNMAIQLMQNKSVTTQLEFEPDWGWGSSSTLLHLLEQWLKINPYQLMDDTFGGSGYDIACAGSNNPIFYSRMPGELPIINQTAFNPPFIDKIGVVWLNQKQTTASEVRRFIQSDSNSRQLTDEITVISHQLAQTTCADTFTRLMMQHEKLIANATGLTPVQQKLFPDFEGTVKSLGAWGGDFIMYFSHLPFADVKKWFLNKGYHTLFPIGEVMA